MSKCTRTTSRTSCASRGSSDRRAECSILQDLAAAELIVWSRDIRDDSQERWRLVVDEQQVHWRRMLHSNRFQLRHRSQEVASKDMDIPKLGGTSHECAQTQGPIALDIIGIGELVTVEMEVANLMSTVVPKLFQHVKQVDDLIADVQLSSKTPISVDGQAW